MGLTAAQLAAREGKITASFAPQLMAGDIPAIHNKWLELIGDPSWQPEDLSDNWPVQFGSFIEGFALDWHERRTQYALTRRGEVVQHPILPHVACTLDGFREFDQCAIDCKCVGHWRKLDEVLAFYQPQLILQRACVRSINCALLIVHGGAAPVEYSVTIDPDYEVMVWQRIDQFWRCVQLLIPPVEGMKLPPLTPPEQWRTIDLDQPDQLVAYNWAPDMKLQLGTWDATHDAAQRNETARDEIKKLLPEDAGKLSCGGLTVTRNRARAVSIKRGSKS